jgi:two-component system chemotaxis response regulator CheY
MFFPGEYTIIFLETYYNRILSQAVFVFPGGKGMSMTILIVDDSRIMRNTVKSVFTGLSVSCIFVEANDGEEAIKQLEMYPINLVLLDWNMPKLSGIDFLKKVRAIEKYKTLPIVMVTSEANKFNVIEALKSGATDYITKPINLDLFREKITKLPSFSVFRR